MSAPEISHRLQNKFQSEKERFFGTGAECVPAPVFSDAPAWIYADSRVCQNEWLAAAGKVIEGRLDVFNLSGCELGNPPQWNRDPKTRILAPLDFGKSMDYRDEAVVGDIKYLWEPSRHLQLVPLCMAYKISGDARYLDAFAEQLQSWFDQCPYMRGVHWASSLELAIRLLNWSICWQLIGGKQSTLFTKNKEHELLENWLDSIFQHCHFINGHYSRFSSANNHLIGEASGVFVASQTWPYWSQLAEWGRKARGILETEAVKQTYPDGVNKEQAVSYQQFVLDFFLLPFLSARANSSPFSTEFSAVIELMMDYLAAMLDVDGNMPMLGDADDGYAVKLDYGPDFCPYRSLLATGAALFGKPVYKAKAVEFDDKSLLLLGSAGKKIFQDLCTDAHIDVPDAFRHGGYYLLGSEFNTANEIKMIVDAGALGYGGIAAHGHADALALYLSVAGHEILVDPGTYAYHTEKKWRDYFRGTSAHNTVRVDGQDQSAIGGNFMWLRKAEATVETFKSDEQGSTIEASHDGYLALDDPVTHRRKIHYRREGSSYQISDVFICNGRHLAEQFWHFAEDCTVKRIDASTVVVSSGPVRVRVHLDPALSAELVTGRETPPLGWVSRRFDNKSPTVTICATSTFSGNAEFISRIEISETN